MSDDLKQHTARTVKEGDGSYTVTVTLSGAQGEPGPPGPPGNDGLGVPAGGTTGQQLAKSSDADNDTEWVTPLAGVPAGGTTGQHLAKASDADNDTEWVTPPAGVPVGGTTGQHLAKRSSTDNDAEWVTPSVVRANTAEVTLAGDGGTTPLSAALTGTRSGDLTLASGGNLYLGDKASASAPGVYLRRATAPSPMTGTFVISNSFGASGAVTMGFSTDDGATATLYLNKDSQLGVGVAGGVLRPVPFAVSAGQATITIGTANVLGGIVVVFPANRFTQIPIVTSTSISNAGWIGSNQSTTVSQVSVYVRNADNVAGTGTYLVNWIAIQMTPTSTPGAPVAREGEGTNQHTSTCHTDGCENQDIPITGEMPDGCGGVWCGACSREITDVVTARYGGGR